MDHPIVAKLVSSVKETGSVRECGNSKKNSVITTRVYNKDTRAIPNSLGGESTSTSWHCGPVLDPILTTVF
jgi:hypothetical protein